MCGTEFVRRRGSGVEGRVSEQHDRCREENAAQSQIALRVLDVVVSETRI